MKRVGEGIVSVPPVYATAKGGQTHLTGVLCSGFEEATQVLFLVEHVFSALVDSVSQREVGVLEQLLR